MAAVTVEPGAARSGRPSGSWWTVTVWILTMLALVLAVVLPLGVSGKEATLPVLLLAIPIAVIDGARRYGWVALVFFLVETLVVSNVFEDLSIETGFPFGNYHYTGGPQLIHVPVYIGPVYFGLGYLCWRVAALLLDGADTRLASTAKAKRWLDVFALPATAAVLMSLFDLGSDSLASTANHAWEWEHGGGIFGVPYTNYLGWWLVTWLFFQIFAVFLTRRGARRASTEQAGPSTLAPPAIVYGALALNAISYFLAIEDIAITDPSGSAWSAHAMAETMMTINLFGVLPFALLALRACATRAPADRAPSQTEVVGWIAGQVPGLIDAGSRPKNTSRR